MKAPTTIPAPIDHGTYHRQPWGAIAPPVDERCERCHQPAGYLVLNERGSWLCGQCQPPPERGSAA